MNSLEEYLSNHLEKNIHCYTEKELFILIRKAVLSNDRPSFDKAFAYFTNKVLVEEIYYKFLRKNNLNFRIIKENASYYMGIILSEIKYGRKLIEAKTLYELKSKIGNILYILYRREYGLGKDLTSDSDPETLQLISDKNSLRSYFVNEDNNLNELSSNQKESLSRKIKKIKKDNTRIALELFMDGMPIRVITEKVKISKTTLYNEIDILLENKNSF